MNIYNTLEEKYIQAVEELNYGDPVRALQLHNEIIEVDGNYARSLYGIGLIYFRYVNDYQAAGYYLCSAIEADPSFPEAYVPFLELLVMLNRAKTVQDYAVRALATEGVNEAAVYEQLGIMAEKARDWKRASANFREALLSSVQGEETERLENALHRVEGKLRMTQNVRYVMEL